jgi:hypothetical protein
MSAEESSAAGRCAAPLVPRDVPANASGVLQGKALHVGTVDSPVLSIMREWLSATAAIVSLGLCMLIYRQSPSATYWALGVCLPS